MALGAAVVGFATGERQWAGSTADLAELEAAHPRWVVWSAGSTRLARHGLRPRALWDLAAVHKVLHGGRRDDPAAVWAAAHRLPVPPRPGDDLTLLDAALSVVEGFEGPVRPDGLLHPDAERATDPVRWATLALSVQRLQEEQLRALVDPRPVPSGPALPLVTAWAESAAALLCVEMEHDGLPVDRAEALRLIAATIGDGDRSVRDAPVLALLRGDPVDLRSPGQVRDALLRLGIEVPDTRSWRLEPYRQAHPVVDALLTWRKAERVATTYGYGWLAQHVGQDDRLRGEWTAADGGAGRMTASAGLHSLPVELRSAVAAEPGHVLVRADLGQVEPRVLAAVSGDRGLARAAAEDDMYTPVARQLGCDRPTAKVAVLAAMYGQTSGAAGQALKQMEQAYPTALAFLRAAEEAGRVGTDVRTHGGRLVRVGSGGVGRYSRNAVVQGAAAELFKVWAASVRNGLGTGRVVLCLHDELLLHVKVEDRDAAITLLHEALEASAAHWAAGSGVRFVADVAAVRRWSEAKD
ncbi:MAG: DNA-directed polymerase [Frankiales bacterium]|nr:DNA-directed polymerase [Frankiales bacterium]